MTIHSKDFESHLEHISIVLKRLSIAGLKLKLQKCTWCAKRIELLGHIVENNSISMEPKKISIIRVREAPKTVKQL
ncbi:MAG: hypothetical protein KC463_07105 [Streptococcus sp.]|nr:hypothetical protein [Streptococcus sp.]